MKKDDVVTKEYLDKKLGTFKKEIKSDVGKMGNEIRKELKKDMSKMGGELKGELYEIKDEIVGEIKSLREEFDAHQYSHVRINKELEEHSEQIEKLQVAVSAN